MKSLIETIQERHKEDLRDFERILKVSLENMEENYKKDIKRLEKKIKNLSDNNSSDNNLSKKEEKEIIYLKKINLAIKELRDINEKVSVSNIVEESNLNYPIVKKLIDKSIFEKQDR